MFSIVGEHKTARLEIIKPVVCMQSTIVKECFIFFYRSTPFLNARIELLTCFESVMVIYQSL